MICGGIVHLLILLLVSSDYFMAFNKYQPVGHASHFLEDDKVIVKMNSNWTVTKNEELRDYRGSPYACDVTIENNGDIILKYERNSNTSREGCIVDMLVDIKKEDPRIHFTATLSNDEQLKNCLKHYKNGINSNMFAFVYNIDKLRFTNMKNGPMSMASLVPYYVASKRLEDCIEKEGNELAWNGLELGWRYEGDNINKYMSFVGEPVIWLCNKDDQVTSKESEFKFDLRIEAMKAKGGQEYYGPNIKGDCGMEKNKELNGERLICQTNNEKEMEKYEPKYWKIKRGIYNEKGLFVFYLLPRRASRSRINGKLSYDYEEINCKDIKIKFPGSEYKLLVNYSPDPTTTSTTSNITTKSTTTSTTKTIIKATESSNTFIIIVVIGVIFVIVLIVGIVLFVIMSGKKDKKNNNADDGDSTKGTNIEENKKSKKKGGKDNKKKKGDESKTKNDGNESMI